MNGLADFFSSRVKAEVFRLLFGIGNEQLYVREIERRSGLSISTVRQELKRLAGFGLVAARVDGNRTYYRANQEHPLYPDIRSMVLKTSGLADVLREAMREENIRMAFVFGSLARKEENPRSDIDLMVIGAITFRRLAKCLAGVAERLGREINPHVMSPEEFQRRQKKRDHFLSSVLSAPRIWVIGDEHELEAMGCHPTCLA